MRSVKAKALRKALGFKPREQREYNMGKPSYVASLNHLGQPMNSVITGTISCVGARRSYKAAKRHPALAAAILGAK